MADIEVGNHGSLFTFTPLTQAGRDWIAENVSGDSQWLGGSLCVEHRYAYALADGMRYSGLEVA